jgi:hypothetical protein
VLAKPVIKDTRRRRSSATGRFTTASLTTIAAITQLLPYPVLAGPGAEPSRNQPAAQGLLAGAAEQCVVDPTVTGYPAGTSSAAVSFATARP